MEITIINRNLDLGKALKKYIYKRLSKIQRLYKRIYRCEIVLEEEKIRKKAEIIIHLKRNRIIAKESSLDIFTSIDNAVSKIRTQLRRLNERVVSARRQRAEVRRQRSDDI